MRYISTRGAAPAVSFLDAILAGLAPDGGLYAPETWPRLPASADFARRAGTGHFTYAAAHVLHAFAGEDLSFETCAQVVGAAYLASGEGEALAPAPWPLAVAPLIQVGPGDWIMELFHGPSLSFKDVAMQLIARLYDVALARRDRRLTVVCATSGDTGGAAAEALKGRERIDLFVLLPKGRVSDVQRRFMTATGADNVHAIEIDGDFDACQALVKAMFADRDFAAAADLSGVNSINWARITAQSVYYAVAAFVLAAHHAPSFVVPTGNFGDAYSGWVARRMGAPVGRIVLGVNANDILARALETGRYERAERSIATISPAMDIQVASNFERILFEALERDSEATAGLYAQFAQSGGFDIPEAALGRLRADFAAAAVSDEDTRRAIAWYGSDGYVACPHTAVALFARTKLPEALAGPVVTLATAHPAKFPEAVGAVIGRTPLLPARARDLFERPERVAALPDDLAAVQAFIRERSRAWRGS
jgi:threonine synthase